MSATYYVDLSLASTNTGHIGSDLDPFSWTDMRSLLLVQAQNPVDLEFRLRGSGEVLSLTNKVVLAGTTGNTQRKIVFTSDDVVKYGFPVFRTDTTVTGPPMPGNTGNSLSANSLFFEISGFSNLLVDVSNCLFDLRSVSAFTVFDIHDLAASRVRFHNNTVLSRNASTQLVNVHDCTQATRVAYGFNTVLVKSSSNLPPVPLFGIGSSTGSNSMSGFFGNNYVARHASNAYMVSVLSVGAGTLLRYGGNRFGGDQNYINPYIGSGTRLSNGIADNICDYATQGIENDSFFGGTEAYTPKRTSTFWPVNAGLLLNAGTGYDVTQDYTLGIGTHDARGYARSGYDAGAFEKSHVSTTQRIHVDLAGSGTTQASGTSDDPISLTDMLTLYPRLAPVVDDIYFVLRNSNYLQSPIPEMDFGPLSPNTTASDRRFGGSGKIVFQGYRTQISQLPLLRINKLRTNNNCLVVLEKLKLTWVSSIPGDPNPVFIQSDASTGNNNALFCIRNSVVKTADTVSGPVLAGPSLGLSYLLLGNVFYIKHTSNLAGGVFVFGSGASTMALNTIAVDSSIHNIGVVGSGSVDFCGNYINGTTNWTFAGATSRFNTASTANLSDVFEDPFAGIDSTTHMDMSSWKFSGNVSTPLDVVSVSDAGPVVRQYCGTDARDLTRDASPNGSPTYDSGPYEYTYFIPQTKYRYVDLSKSTSGHSGAINDRWSYEDMAGYLESLNYNSTTLDTPVEINCINATNTARGIDLHDIEVSPTGGLVIKAENPYALACIEAVDTRPLISIKRAYGLVLEFDSLITKSRGYLPVIDLVGDSNNVSQSSSVRVKNSILWHKDMMCVIVSDITNILAGQSLTIDGVTKVFGSGAGTIAIAETTAEQAQNIVRVFNADPVFALSRSCVLVAAGTIGISSTSTITGIGSNSSGIVVKDSSTPGSIVHIGPSWDFVSIGSGYSEVTDPGASARTTSAISYASGSTGLVAYCNISGSSGSDFGIQAHAGIASEVNAFHGFGTSIQGAVDTNSRTSLNPIAQDPLSDSVVVTNYTPIGDALNIVHEANLSVRARSYNVTSDILRNLRSQVLFGGSDFYDAGPIDSSGVPSTSGYMNPADTVLAGITPEGYALNCRRDIDGLGFRVVGFAIGSIGYFKYDPTKVLGFAGSGAQSRASVLITTNTFSALDQIAITIGTTTITKQFNTALGWQASSSITGTCANIAASFRKDPAFNAYCYCVVSNNSIFFYAKLFGVIGNAYILNSTFGTQSQFQGGIDSLGVMNKVWPETSPYVAFDRFEVPDPTSCGFVVRLDFDECNKPIGQIAVIAEITDSPIASEIGSLHVYAFANTPLHVKHNREVLVKRLLMQF